MARTDNWSVNSQMFCEMAELQDNNKQLVELGNSRAAKWNSEWYSTWLQPEPEK